MATQNSTPTQEQVKSLFNYKDGDLYWKKSLTKNHFELNKKAGSLRGNKYLRVFINKKSYANHRIIFLYHYGYLPKFIDHIDNNKLNNKIENLREATVQQNNCNTKLRKDNTSGIKGVHKVQKKWLVRVQINNKRKIIGRFDDLELAELVAIEARNKYHKEFARHH